MDSAEDIIYPFLHHLESSLSLRVLWALEELNEARGLQYGIKVYPRGWDTSSLKKIHPLGKSPILSIGPKPEQQLTEARLILQYLSDTYSKGLWEPTEDDKARDVFFQEFANRSLQMRVSQLAVSNT